MASGSVSVTVSKTNPRARTVWAASWPGSRMRSGLPEASSSQDRSVSSSAAPGPRPTRCSVVIARPGVQSEVRSGVRRETASVRPLAGLQGERGVLERRDQRLRRLPPEVAPLVLRGGVAGVLAGELAEVVPGQRLLVDRLGQLEVGRRGRALAGGRVAVPADQDVGG